MKSARRSIAIATISMAVVLARGVIGFSKLALEVAASTLPLWWLMAGSVNDRLRRVISISAGTAIAAIYALAYGIIFIYPAWIAENWLYFFVLALFGTLIALCGSAFRSLTWNTDVLLPWLGTWSRLLLRSSLFLINVLLIFIIANGGFYIVFFSVLSPSISQVSYSPSGTYSFETEHSCWLHNCTHSAQVSERHAWFRTPGFTCDMRIPHQHRAGINRSSMKWNAGETVISWRTTGGLKGQVDLRRDCGSFKPNKAPIVQ